MATVQELIQQAEKREVLLPEFQRGYVWTRDQVRPLLDLCTASIRPDTS
jgi:uncharacterized protein with ParB-like and HNH nuclease domain